MKLNFDELIKVICNEIELQDWKDGEKKQILPIGNKSNENGQKSTPILPNGKTAKVLVFPRFAQLYRARNPSRIEILLHSLWTSRKITSWSLLEAQH